MATLDFVVRLRSAIEASERSRAEIARLANVPAQVLTNMLAGNTPGHRHVPNLARVLNVPLDWLLTGRSAALEDRVAGFVTRVNEQAEAVRANGGCPSFGQILGLLGIGLTNKADTPPAAQEYAYGLTKSVPSSLTLRLDFEEQLLVLDALSVALISLDSRGEAASQLHRLRLEGIRDLILEHNFGELEGEGDATRLGAKMREMLAKIAGARSEFEHAAGASNAAATASRKTASSYTRKGGAARGRAAKKRGAREA